MRTAVSVPDSVFEKAERLARRAKKSRSQIFSEALREYLLRKSAVFADFPPADNDSASSQAAKLPASRSRERLARHSPDEVTDAMNRVADEIGEGTDEFVGSASRRILDRTEW